MPHSCASFLRIPTRAYKGNRRIERSSVEALRVARASPDHQHELHRERLGIRWAKVSQQPKKASLTAASASESSRSRLGFELPIQPGFGHVPSASDRAHTNAK